MELALNLGYRSVEELEREMSVAEFLVWYKYRNKMLLPIRRFEYYFAQLTAQVSNVYAALGGKAYGIKDFLIEPVEKPKPAKDTAETGAQAIGAMVGGLRVIHIGKRKKANG